MHKCSGLQCPTGVFWESSGIISQKRGQSWVGGQRVTATAQLHSYLLVLLYLIHFIIWTNTFCDLDRGSQPPCAALSKLCTKQQRSRGCTWRAAHCVAREECSSHHGPYLPPQIPLKTHHFDAGQTHHSAHRAEAPQRKPGRGEDYIQKILVAHIICFEEK